jgi:hypothetical protein
MSSGAFIPFDPRLIGWWGWLAACCCLLVVASAGGGWPPGRSNPTQPNSHLSQVRDAGHVHFRAKKTLLIFGNILVEFLI